VGLKSKQRIEVVPNNYEDVDHNPQIPCEEVSVLHRVVVKNIMCSVVVVGLSYKCNKGTSIMLLNMSS
jgi:hypothetical protein